MYVRVRMCGIVVYVHGKVYCLILAQNWYVAYTYKIHTYKKEKVRHAFHLTDCSADIAQPYILYCKWIRFQLIEQLVNYKVNSTILRKVLLSKNCQLPGLHLKLTICHYHCQRCSVMHDGHGISAKSKHHLRPFSGTCFKWHATCQTTALQPHNVYDLQQEMFCFIILLMPI